MRNQKMLSMALTMALLLAACASGVAESAELSTTSVPVESTTSVTVESTTTTVSNTTTAPASPSDDEMYELLTDEVVYHEDDDGTWKMKVFYPDAPGPWPLVIVYHGMTTSPSSSLARTIAERGAVAIAPQWLKETAGVLTRGEYIDGMLFDRAACAVNTAQQRAADYGADPERTTVSGFSAGIHPTGWVGLGVVRNDLCETPQMYQPVGLVLGDSQFIFYEEGWDELLAGPDGSPAADTIDRYVNPERWDVPDDLVVYLWTSDFRYGRDVESQQEADTWIKMRDTTGTLLDDLVALDAFDDEWIDFMDNGLLMEMRMKEAGIEVVHEAVGGGHLYGPKVFDAIEALISG